MTNPRASDLGMRLTMDGRVLAAGADARRMWFGGAAAEAVDGAIMDALRLAAARATETVVPLPDGRALAARAFPQGDELEVVALDVSDTARRARDGDRLFALAADFVCVATIDGFFVRVSPSGAALLGRSEHELLTRPFLDFVHPDDVAGTVHEMGTLASGVVTRGFANRYLRGDGEWIWLEWAATPHSGFIYAIARDVTGERALRLDLLASREAAEAANAAKTVFLAHMSHELRTPLNAIIGYSELLLEDADAEGCAALAADIKPILDAGHQLLALINDVLDVSKIEAGHVELFLERFRARDLIESVAATIRPVADRNGNRLEIFVPDDVELCTDRLKLQQILLNLASNAARFTTGGQVAIALRSEGDMVIATVTDNGVGLDPGDIERAFRPFEQVATSPGGRGVGTGLGLSLALRFAEILGGRLTVASAPGQGSTFAVCVPRHAPFGGDASSGGRLVVVPDARATNRSAGA